MGASGVMRWEIWADDARKLQRFYAELFGWEFKGHPDANAKFAGVESVTTSLSGGIGQVLQDDGSPQEPVPVPFPRGITVWVEVDAFEPYLTRAVELGGGVVAPPYQIPQPSAPMAAAIRDPENNVIGLISRRR